MLKITVTTGLKLFGHGSS